MPTPSLLLHRLDQIAASLSRRPTARALIGLGSVGLERDRLDAWSDLDFFAIVQVGSKASYLADLSWLSVIAPVAYAFQNTVDGYKVLYEDGVFCEFAVFDEDELQTVVFSPGRVIWKTEGVPDTVAIPQRTSPPPEPPATEWLLGEALTNLYVGLGRERRGEHLAALRLIQGHAIDRILELAERVEVVNPAAPADPFNRDRRIEQRIPTLTDVLPELVQGYDRNRESALAALDWLDQRFEVNSGIKEAILALAEDSFNIPQ
jgi:hypothetical protein